VNFIDFGFMEKKSTRIYASKLSANWLGNKHHWSFPFEAVYWNKDDYMTAASVKGKSKKAYREFAESVANNCQYFFTSIMHFNANTSKRDKTAEVGTRNAFRNVLNFEPTDESYDQFIDKSIDSVDTYGLGIALMFVLHRSKHLLSDEFYKNVMNLGVNMLDGRVFLRSTSEQLLAQYEDILTNSGLLEKHNKHIENHLIANGVSDEMKVAAEIANSTDMLSIPRMAAATGATEIVRECPPGKEFNPLTKRCVNVCKPGYVRNPSFKCVSSKRLAKTIKSSIQSIPKNTSVRSLHSLSLKMTRSRSPQKTRSRSPQKTRSMSPQKTRSMSLKMLRSMSPQKTRSLSLKKTKSRSPQKTRSMSLKMLRSMSPQMPGLFFPQQMTRSFPQQMTRSFPQQMTRSMSPERAAFLSPQRTISIPKNTNVDSLD
jgi:hypothetical protein